ncbi:methyltransferase domain protein [Ceratobasidium sp. AG-Ba]|nr:methyltransferase domain protein [Ceratobasidium sp. AG-Ba]QRW12812.1 methyltransferase domain protein [Ceratobasidium sp. AG-Ba]
MRAFWPSEISVTNRYQVALIREAYRVLRPGGLIVVNDHYPGLWDPEDITIPARQAPKGCKFYNIIRQHISKLGADPDVCEKMPQWLAPDSDHWDNGQSGFREIQLTMRTRPWYPHEDHTCMDPIDATIAPYARYLAVASIRDLTGLIKDSGLTDEEAENLAGEAIEEMKHPESCSIFKAYSIHALKM